MNEFSFGAMPSPDDNRDYPINKIIAKNTKVPDIYLPEIDAPIYDQGRSSQCVACSLALTRFMQEKEQTNNIKKFSATYIYGNREDDMFQDEGMYPREALKILKNFGTPHWDKLPGHYSYIVSKQKYLDNKEALDQEAYPYRISSYYRLSTDEEIKQAIYTMGAVSAMFPVYSCLDNAKDGFVEYTGEKENLRGYHQMTIIGWTDKYWIVQNSWGKTWGSKGLCYIPYNYPIQEAWAIVDNILEQKLQKKTCKLLSFLKKLFSKE